MTQFTGSRSPSKDVIEDKVPTTREKFDEAIKWANDIYDGPGVSDSQYYHSEDVAAAKIAEAFKKALLSKEPLLPYVKHSPTSELGAHIEQNIAKTAQPLAENKKGR